MKQRGQNITLYVNPADYETYKACQELAGVMGVSVSSLFVDALKAWAKSIDPDEVGRIAMEKAKRVRK